MRLGGMSQTKRMMRENKLEEHEPAKCQRMLLNRGPWPKRH